MLNYLKRKCDGYPQVSDAALIFFCGYVISWYLQIGIRMPSLGQIRFEFFYAAVLSALALMIFLQKEIRLDCPAIKWAALLYVMIFAQVLLSHDFNHSWVVFIERVLKFSFMSFFIISFVNTPKSLVFFLAAFLIACLKMGQEGFFGMITGSMMWENQGVMRLHGITPLYRHPNSFAGMALGTLPFLLYLYPIASKKIKLFFIILFVFAFNIVLHSGSRTGYVALLVMVFIYLYKTDKKKKTILILGAILLAFWPLLDAQYMDRFKSIYVENKDGYDMTSREKRIEILKDAVKIFQDNPFGVGVGAFPVVRQRTFGRSQDTHNLYLEVATNLGIQGLAVFLVFVAVMLKSSIVVQKNIAAQKRKLIIAIEMAENRGLRPGLALQTVHIHLKDLDLIASTAQAVFLFICVRLALGLFGMDLYEIYWWFSLGLIVALWNISRYAQKITEENLNSLSFQPD